MCLSPARAGKHNQYIDSEERNNVRTFQIANIKHKKEKNDAAKGKIFTIIGREIAVAVKEGGSDPSNNFKLAKVIAKAKSNNMPNETIERGIKKAAGDLGNVNFQYNTYEGYGPGGIAIIVDTLTDNLNRTAAKMSDPLLQKATAVSEHPAAYPLCLTRRARSSLIKRTVTSLQTI